jgi:methanesulfonate monooxygenase subunit beta
VRTLVEEVVYRSCLLLDERDFEGFLELCEVDFRYTVHAHSPELRREMVWLDLDRPGMQTLFRNLPRHHSDPSPLTRHATVYTVAFDPLETQAAVVSALQVFRTALDGGATSLFAVGKMRDTVSLTNGKARLARRAIHLDTRQLGIGSHIPF